MDDKLNYLSGGGLTSNNNKRLQQQYRVASYFGNADITATLTIKLSKTFKIQT